MEDFNWESKIVSIVVSVLISFGLAKLGCGRVLSSIGGETAGAATENYYSTKSSSKKPDEYPAKKVYKKDYSSSSSLFTPSLDIPKSDKCSWCSGSGFRFSTKTCTACDITGRVSCPFCKGTGISSTGYTDCSFCDGWGMANCYTCEGDGEVPQVSTCFFCDGTGYK